MFEKVWMGEARENKRASGPAQPISIDMQEGRRRAVAKESVVVVVVLGLGIILLLSVSEKERCHSQTDRQKDTHTQTHTTALTHLLPAASQVSLDAADMQGVHACFFLAERGGRDCCC